MQKQKQPFRLPMTLTFLSGRLDGKFLVHSLDFDIVSVARDEDTAMTKMRMAVKTYVEYGLSKGWKEHIVFPAPQSFWDCLGPDTPTKIAPPITVGDVKRIVLVGNCELRRAA
jgi:hypothetical protein